MFQPGEEGKGGAAKLMENYPNLLDNVEYCFGIHLGNHKLKGIVSVTDDYINANSNRFSIEIQGKASHVMVQNVGIDAAYIGSQLIGHLYSMRSRVVSPMSQGTLCVTSIQGGKNLTSVMDEIKIQGSLRTISTEDHNLLMKELETFSIKFCENFGAKCKVKIGKSNYRAIKNDPNAVKLVRKEMSDLLGGNKVEVGKPAMHGEDFCEFSERVPSCYFILGSAVPGSID